MSDRVTRRDVLPEAQLPATAELIERGRERAREVKVGPSPFASLHGVSSELEYKRRCISEGRVMLHGQVGFRDRRKSGDAFESIHSALAAKGYRVDRYGICLDWSMGYPRAQRADRPRGTGLILGDDTDFMALTKRAPVAAHFGDFVMGMPAAVENTTAALRAGSTCIGNLGQYFTFRLPHWDDDVTTTAATVEAIALAAAQTCEVLVHSNLDDGFAAMFADLSCAVGAVLLECRIVEQMLGARLGHCYGHTYSGVSREVFQLALACVTDSPGTMIYGNTTSYRADEGENYDVLERYLRRDFFGQRRHPTGHALNPVPVTEAMRIPDTDEIVDAHVFANRLFERLAKEPTPQPEVPQARIDEVVRAGRRFHDDVLLGLDAAGVDVDDAVELLLSLRRIGARRLEELFGPGPAAPSQVRGREPIFAAPGLEAVAAAVMLEVDRLDRDAVNAIGAADLTVCVASTDVHEYGKLLVEGVLRHAGVRVEDAGVSSDPDHVAASAKAAEADAVAVSTYNGVALDYLRRLRDELDRIGLAIPVFIGGKLNQVPDDPDASMPVDVEQDLVQAGAVVCRRVEDMMMQLRGLTDDTGGSRR